ncbi:MAG: pyruvate, water dikinase regulatory protein [Coriobacteriia bacterium]|nr:pyruvate, water dikinase regulatory protein [Coriobacteriia bacterium]
MDRAEHGAGSLPLAVYLLSDSLGETADLVGRAAISQFPRGTFDIIRLAKISSAGSLEEAISGATHDGSVFLYTLADPALRDRMSMLAREKELLAVDILGPTIAALGRSSGVEPTGEAGAIRRTDRGYVQHIEALEYAVKHDDGRDPEGLADADVVLIGVSRTGKTPVSMYLAFKGYKAANIPLIPEVEPPAQLFDLDSRRIFGLTGDVDFLVSIRNQRLSELGVYARRYAQREAVIEEIESARALMRKLGCIVVRTDNRAIEETAQEIIRYLEE